MICLIVTQFAIFMGFFLQTMHSSRVKHACIHVYRQIVHVATPRIVNKVGGLSVTHIYILFINHLAEHTTAVIHHSVIYV